MVIDPKQIERRKALLTGESRVGGFSKTLLLVTRDGRFCIIDALVFHNEDSSGSIFTASHPLNNIKIRVERLSLPTSWTTTIPEPQFKRKHDKKLPFRVMLKNIGTNHQYLADRFPIDPGQARTVAQNVSGGELFIPYSFLECRQKEEHEVKGWEKIYKTRHTSTWDNRISFIDPDSHRAETIPEKQAEAIDLYQAKLNLEDELRDVNERLYMVDPYNKIPRIHTETRKRMMGAIQNQ